MDRPKNHCVLLRAKAQLPLNTINAQPVEKKERKNDRAGLNSRCTLQRAKAQQIPSKINAQQAKNKFNIRNPKY